MSQNSYLVLGGGHVSLATAVHSSSQGNSVYLFSRRQLAINKTKIVRSTALIKRGNYSIVASSHQIQEITIANDGKLPRNIIICCRGQDLEF